MDCASKEQIGRVYDHGRPSSRRPIRGLRRGIENDEVSTPSERRTSLDRDDEKKGSSAESTDENEVAVGDYIQEVTAADSEREGEEEIKNRPETTIESLKELVDKKAKVKAQMRKFTLDDCECIPAGQQKVKLRIGKETDLKSIGGYAPDYFTVDQLKYFCSANKVKGYRNGQKQEICDLIVKHALSQGDGQGQGEGNPRPSPSPAVTDTADMSSDNEGHTKVTVEQSGGASSVTVDKEAATKPKGVTRDSTLFRFINVLFHKQNRALVMALAKGGPSQPELDHDDVYRRLAECHNSRENDTEGIDEWQHAHHSLRREEENVDLKHDFDTLTSEDTERLTCYIRDMYQQTVSKRLKSSPGDSQPQGNIEDLVGTNTFLVYYHLMMERHPDVADLLNADLVASAVVEELEVEKPNENESGKASTGEQRRPRRPRRKRKCFSTRKLTQVIIQSCQDQAESSKMLYESRQALAQLTREKAAISVEREYYTRYKSLRDDLRELEKQSDCDPIDFEETRSMMTRYRNLWMAAGKKLENLGTVDETDKNGSRLCNKTTSKSSSSGSKSASVLPMDEGETAEECSRAARAARADI